MIENRTHFVFQRKRGERSSARTAFRVEVLRNVCGTFAEPKSKERSRRYHLTSLEFDKSEWDRALVEAFWSYFQIKYVPTNRRGQVLPPIYLVIGTPSKLIHGGYVVICEQQKSGRAAFLRQASYIHWIEKFALQHPPYGDITDVPSDVIGDLLNKLAVNRNIIDDIPREQAWRGWRLIEQLVAEIFKRKGYEVTLTPPARDGGWDIIAYKTNERSEVEALLIECKHWKDPVGVGVVDRLVGAASRFNVVQQPPQLMLVTTSSFTSVAKGATYQRPPIQPQLAERRDLLRMVDEVNAVSFGYVELAAYFTSLRETAQVEGRTGGPDA